METIGWTTKKEFDLCIDVVLIVYMFIAKMFFVLKEWCDKLVKSEDAQESIINNFVKDMNPSILSHTDA